MSANGVDSDEEVVDSDEDVEPQKPNLVYEGSKYSKKIFKSSLYKSQKEALRKIVKWFSDGEETRDSTAVVVMPTGTGVICCLPYVIGGAINRGTISSIDLSKPILVIAPGLDILKQLEDSLLLHPF